MTTTTGSAVPMTSLIRDALARASIVVVDDGVQNVVLLERVLRSAGASNVAGFSDPREALAACTRTAPDLLLLDLHMPHLDAVELVARIRAAHPGELAPPWIVLTADVTAGARERVLAAGARDSLTKPFDVADVLLRVRNALETGALLRRLHEHNLLLAAELEEHTAARRREAAAEERARQLLDQALHGGALSAVYQPIVDLATGAVVGAEALARFATDPPRTPDVWFAEAARIGRGVELELKAIEVALTGLDDLPAGAFLSVNASAQTISSPELATTLRGASPERIVVELTEHERVPDYRQLSEALRDLRSLGVRLAVDDTGAGYASLAHILRLEADVLKLDIDLTRGIDVDPVRRSLAAALVGFAADVGATLLAEGVETAAELAVLRELGFPWGQGYHLCRPSAPPVPAWCSTG